MLCDRIWTEARLATLSQARPGLGAIEDLHIWTAESVRADRLDFRPKHRLTVLVVQAWALSTPVELIRTPEFAGCKSWVELTADAGRARAVHDDATLQRIAERVRASVG